MAEETFRHVMNPATTVATSFGSVGDIECLLPVLQDETSWSGFQTSL
jgi:hypothetical protein